MQKLLTILLACICSVLISTSCVHEEKLVSLDGNPYEDLDYTPMVLTVYYPYPTFLSDDTPTAIRPMPTYSGWTDERMERDLKRMMAAGFDGAILSISPEYFKDPVRRQRLQHFFQLASECQPMFKIALRLCSDKPMSIYRQDLVNFMQKQGLSDIPCSLKLENIPVLVLDESINLLKNDLQSENRFIFRKQGESWPSLPEGAEIGEVSLPDLFCWVRGGDNRVAPENENGESSREWLLPRGKGRNLANRLRHAFKKKARIICVHSWNNFSDGSFLEPNTLDQDTLTKVLKKELDKIPRPRQPCT